MIRDFGNGKYSKDICLGERIKSKEVRAQEVEWTMDDFIRGTVNHDPTYIHRDLYEKYGTLRRELKDMFGLEVVCKSSSVWRGEVILCTD